MNEQAEKSAKRDMSQELKEKRSTLAALLDEAEGIGKQLERFGRVFANSSWSFTCRESSIVAKSKFADPDVEISFACLNAETIRSLVEDIEETRRAVSTLEQRLRDAGL